MRNSVAAVLAVAGSAAALALAVLAGPAAHAASYQPTGDGTGWTLVNNYGGHGIADHWKTHTLIGANCTQTGSISVDSNNDLELTTTGAPTNCAEVTSPFTVHPTSAQDVFIEYKARVPGDTWAALWSTGYPGPWPRTGEIDTAEILSLDTDCHSFHFRKPKGGEGTLGGLSHARQDCFRNVAGRWTTFGVQWTPASLTFFVNGVRSAHVLSGSEITSNPEEVLMDNLGARWHHGGGSTMLIQYVRTWTKAS